MRDNKWYSGLAFGVVGGLAIAALLFAWLSGGLPNWWKHDGAVVTSKDTLANWLVAIFSFVAAVFLWLTLLATQEMAKDTRRIGEAQVRAYLTLRSATLEVDADGSLQNRLILDIVNSGGSPALEVAAHVFQTHNSWSGVIIPDVAAHESFLCSTHYTLTVPIDGPDWVLHRQVKLRIMWKDVFASTHTSSFEYSLLLNLPIKKGSYGLARNHTGVLNFLPTQL